jgi:hypothetical protein
VHARDITCTITVDVPVLIELPAPSFTGCFRSVEEVDLEHWLRKRGIGPDDEIGLFARALLTGMKFRLPDDVKTVYRWSRSVDGVASGFSEMRHVTPTDDTPVVVRVRDILPGYQPLEDK